MTEFKDKKLFFYKLISKIAFGTLIISLLPLVYCSFFDYATGDDLWESAVAHNIIQSGGSLKELFQSVFAWMKVEYMGWKGNWSTTFLQCFTPNIFGEKVYCVTPWIALISLCGGYWYCFKHFNDKYIKISNEFSLAVYSILVFLTIQYMPRIQSGIFWYQAMIVYIFPFGLTMAGFVWMDKYLELGKKRYLLYLSLVLTFISGSGYLAIVLNFELIVLVILGGVISKRIDKKRLGMLFIPLVLLLIGFIISALAPGNAVRGGADYGFSIGKVIYTLKECIVQGAVAIPATMWKVKLLIVLLPLLVMGIWENLRLEESRINFEHPVLVILIMFLISCSVYAPGIYANTECSGGVYDTIYFVFILFYLCSLIYIIGYIKSVVLKRSKIIPWINDEYCRWLVAGGILAACVIGTPFISNNSAYRICIEYIVSGQLADFEKQMQERLEILNDPTITDAVLPGMNDWQGPFLHMCAVEDPTAYTNQCLARYYGKNSVICIPREEYYKIYGTIEQ